MRHRHLIKSKQTSLKNDPYKSPAKPQEIRAGEQSPPCNSRLAWFLPASEVIQRVEIAESHVKRAFRGVPHPFAPAVPFSPTIAAAFAHK